MSSLDISIRAQILELLIKIQIEKGLALLFITHDLSVVRSIAHRVAVMYLGNIVEIGPVEQIFKKPLHPYTKALLSATPIPDPEKSRNRERIVISGEAPSAINPPSGCRFHPRCPYMWNSCVSEIPSLQDREAEKREVACHLMD